MEKKDEEASDLKEKLQKARSTDRLEEYKGNKDKDTASINTPTSPNRRTTYSYKSNDQQPIVALQQLSPYSSKLGNKTDDQPVTDYVPLDKYLKLLKNYNEDQDKLVQIKTKYDQTMKENAILLAELDTVGKKDNADIIYVGDKLGCSGFMNEEDDLDFFKDADNEIRKMSDSKVSSGGVALETDRNVKEKVNYLFNIL